MNLQSVITILTGVIVLLGTVASVVLYLERRFNRLEQRFSLMERRIDDVNVGLRSLNQQVSSLFGILSSLFAALHKAGSIPDEDFRRLTTGVTEVLTRAQEPYVERITAKTNPLSSAEVQRFRQLIAKAQKGEFFSQDDAEEYNYLLKELQKEHGDDPGIWPLVALGAFLLGLYLGSRRQE